MSMSRRTRSPARSCCPGASTISCRRGSEIVTSHVSTVDGNNIARSGPRGTAPIASTAPRRRSGLGSTRRAPHQLGAGPFWRSYRSYFFLAAEVRLAGALAAADFFAAAVFVAAGLAAAFARVVVVVAFAGAAFAAVSLAGALAAVFGAALVAV